MSGPAEAPKRADESNAGDAGGSGTDRSHALPTAGTHGAPALSSADDQPRDAVIYVGGLGLGVTTGKTVAGVVTRLQAAADREAETGSAKFNVRFLEDPINPGSTPGPHLRRVATLSRTDGAKEAPVFDLFEYSWSATLTSQWESQGQVRRAARALLAALRIPRFVRFFRSSGRNTPFGRLQLAMAGAVSIIAIIYLGLLLFAAVQSITQLPTLISGDETPTATSTSTGATPAEEQTDQPSPANQETVSHPGITWVQWSAIVSTIVLPFLTKRRESLASVGAGTFAANAYIRIGDNRERIVEGLVSGAERLREEPLYKSVHVLAYSFGSVVALDALVPRSGPPERSFDKVSRLVTIGMPYEFVQAVDPDYWDARYPGQSPPSWTNIYSRIDLLGSNLRNGPGDGEAELGINSGTSDATMPKFLPAKNLPYDTGIDLDWTTILELYGFVSHGMYWGRDDTPDRNIFRVVIQAIYQGTPTLA